jgi:hypothetical protein
MFLGNALPIRDILPVDEKKVNAVFLDIIGKEGEGKLEAGRTYDIAHKKDIEKFGHGGW